ncbi:MAG: hypothetical protein QOF51_3847 [Chloroflexota bacterium]|jgi:hypothetical protein|nr:hypothetical protein [Chloroflexota bacterium]
MAAPTAISTAEDVGNILSMEHINVTIPDQQLSTLFYIVGMGFTRDPYMNVGLENMWVNIGEQQLHLPTSARPQVLRGHTGIVIPRLEELKARLEQVAPRLGETSFAWHEEDDHLAVISPWGNVYRVFAPGERFGTMTLGMPYIEFDVPPGAAEGIGRFYEQVFESPVAYERDGDTTAVVRVGPRQTLRFREGRGPIPAYDRHHIAIYVGNYSRPFGYCAEHNLVVEEVPQQFRFTQIVDPATQAPLFEIEHEVRNTYHAGYGRRFVNRDPARPRFAQ